MPKWSILFVVGAHHNFVQWMQVNWKNVTTKIAFQTNVIHLILFFSTQMCEGADNFGEKKKDFPVILRCKTNKWKHL